MALNITSSERLHIVFFGCSNAGKSSLVNALTNQNLSVVSDVKGTTTDPVQKTMELLPIGPVVIIDTAGFDDKSELGNLRVEKTMQVLGKTDIAVLVVDSVIGINSYDKELINIFKERNLPYVLVYNKIDIDSSFILENLNNQEKNNDKYSSKNCLKDKQMAVKVNVSAKTGEGINELRDILGKIANKNKKEKYIIRDKLKAGDVVILVIPIDESAPKGRVILPQQNVLRECLDAHANVICCQVEELENVLNKVIPKYVITDSQVFNKVKDIVPENIILTSFSILMANYRGRLKQLLDGAKTLSKLQDDDIILISEACTHHRQCNDIGTVKFPKWISNFAGKKINFEFTQGGEFPKNLSKYRLIIHCGGCMINETEMITRQNYAETNGVPMVNYGMAIAYMNGILERALKIFN